MKSLLRRRMAGTPSANDTFLVKELKGVTLDALEPIMNSPYAGQGVFGIELCSINDVERYALITPSWHRDAEEANMEARPLLEAKEGGDLSCFSIRYLKPSFLPIFFDAPGDVIARLLSLEIPLYIQVLFSKREDHWQKDLIQQYAVYKEGIEIPSLSRFGRKLQHKIIQVLDKVSGYDSQKTSIQEVHDKFYDEGYRCEVRLMIPEGQQPGVEAVLSEWDFFNRLGLVREDKKEFYDAANLCSFSDSSIHQLFSKREVVSFMIGGSSVKPVEVAPKIVSGSIYDLLPIGEKPERVIDDQVVKDIPIALKKAKAIKSDKRLKVRDVELGSTVQRVTFNIPDGSVFTDMRNKLDDIQAALGCELNIEKGLEANTVNFLVPRVERETVYLKELLMTEDFHKYSSENDLPFVCGMDMYNKPVYKCLTKAPHLLDCGATNSGKSVFLNALLLTLIMTKLPSELRLFLIDPKKVEMEMYEGFSHVEEIITDMDKAKNLLAKLVIEMEKRYESMAAIGVKNIKMFNAKSDEKMPYVVCAIDEYNDLIMAHPDVEDLIVRLGQKARAAGIHLIIATQRPDANVISSTLKSNVPSRVSFKLSTQNDYKTVFGRGIPYKNLLGKGDGVVVYDGQTEEFMRFQAPLVADPEDEEDVYERLKEATSGNVQRIELEEIIEESPKEKLMRIILETGETRVDPLRVKMGIRINVVSEMLKELCEEGFLEKKGRGYVLPEENE